MTAATAATPHRSGLHTCGMAVGLASGLAAIAFADLVIGLPLLAGWVL